MIKIIHWIKSTTVFFSNIPYTRFKSFFSHVGVISDERYFQLEKERIDASISPELAQINQRLEEITPKLKDAKSQAISSQDFQQLEREYTLLRERKTIAEIERAGEFPENLFSIRGHAIRKVEKDADNTNELP